MYSFYLLVIYGFIQNEWYTSAYLPAEKSGRKIDNEKVNNSSLYFPRRKYFFYSDIVFVHEKSKEWYSFLFRMGPFLNISFTNWGKINEWYSF